MKIYHHQQFDDASALCQRKQAQGQTISVVIPTLNEESTIAAIVVAIREKLIEQVPLVDEIIIVDSGSADRTCAFAAAAGARVYAAAEIAPEFGNHPGKGENLWKSQFVSSGSICVFIDGDILDFHSGFVTGLVGPLLDHAEVDYVKAFYRRPLQTAVEPSNHGGGRVSELLMRPLFSLFYPQLCEFHQPLAGEYAVRRSLLECLPFPSSYAVETAHLIDALALGGIESFAQCDLDSRTHRNRPLDELGAMACSILQVFLQRAERDGLLHLPEELGKSYIRHVATEQGWRMEEMPILNLERPPLNSLNATNPRS